MTTTRQAQQTRQVPAPRKRRATDEPQLKKRSMEQAALRKDGSSRVRRVAATDTANRVRLGETVPVQRRVASSATKERRSQTEQSNKLHPAPSPVTSRRRVRVATRVETETLLEADSKSGPRAPFVVLILALIVSGMVGLVLLNTAINENAFRLYELKREAKTHDLQEQQYKRDLAELESPGEIDRAAREQGLVHAGDPGFIELPSGEVSGKPKPAGG